ncbi:signal transduction histidine kinase, nitrogen specific, NtrB [Opitutus terrae PB90-1]|uniref:histidine kinase n=1 Tax=Opitutus terrae (strain DSM 11246 / JCM 15787 / PB90-1) TaxID=452637 RepID=B1ZNI1_OPITP|nr:signal transduction histidine kinase, nitrogen specific, NtrB [Opitutus terrae PB90-1]
MSLALLLVSVAASESRGASTRSLTAAGTWELWIIPAVLVVAVASAGWAWWLSRRRSSPQGDGSGRLPHWLQRAADAALLIDEDGRVLDANQRALTLYGYTLAEMQALGPGHLAVNRGEELIHQRTLREADDGRVIATLHRRKDGSTFDATLSGAACVTRRGACLLATVHDVSLIKAAQRKVERTRQLQLMLAQVNQAIIRAESADQIQEMVCQILVETGLFKLAWIGRLDPESAAIRPAAAAGDDHGYLDEISVYADDRAEGRGPVGAAIREARISVCNDFLAAAHTSPWHEAAAKHGLRSSIALPVRVAGQVRAVLSVYASSPNFFGEDETALLEPVAADLSFALDMLEQEKKREQAEARSVLLGTALEGAPNGILITDLHGTIEWANPAFVRASGYAADELVGKNPRLLKSGHHRSEFYTELWRTILAGQTWHGEVVNRRKNGELYVEDLTIIPVRNAAGAIRQFVAISQDITGRKGAERRVREQAALLDQASDAIVVADLNHRVSFWNRGAERLFGTSAREMLGRTLEEAFALDRDVGPTAFHDALAEPRDWRGELRSRNQAGRTMIIETSVTMLRDDHGQPTGRLCISADVTHRKALEEQFLRVQRMENLGMLAAGISHDLNNILAPMRMVGPLLRDRLSEPRDLRLLDTLESCAARGAGLVRQILGFAQGVAGEHRVVQVKHLLRDITDVIAASFPKSIVLEDEIPADLWPVNGNPTQIHQVVLNLCVNARDAMPEGGTLRLRGQNCLLDEETARTIEGARPGPWLVLQVEDTGTGIPADVLSRIWEPLFTTKAPDKGTGLGLSTVRGIVAQHQGLVTVKTEVNRGTTFSVYLPVEETAVTGTGTASPFAATAARGEQVLFVDDEASICELATAVLSRHGYRVLTARDGAEAIAQFAPRIADIALVITDLDMPTLDGAALCRVIHTLSPDTKILATSGFVQAAPPKEAFSGFLPKPFTPEKLLKIVEEALPAKRAESTGSANRA